MHGSSRSIGTRRVTLRDDAVRKNGRFRPGDSILNRYTVIEELGQGGMGIVYKCRDEIGKVDVAIKGLPPEVSRNVLEMEDILENYQLVRTLRHPNIVGVTSLEQEKFVRSNGNVTLKDEPGDYYLVMDFAAGVNLERWRKHNRNADINVKLSILRQVAEALDYAHECGVMHRDIKPENIMVDSDGHVSVLDFGLAERIRTSFSRVSMAVTSRSGTPGYKSPEQWRAQPQGAVADLYALGVVAYVLFAGHLPFDSDDMGVLRLAVLNDPVPPIYGMSSHFNAALRRALAKKPEERFRSCIEFVDALEGKAARSSWPWKQVVGGLSAVVLIGFVAWLAYSNNWNRKRLLPERPVAASATTNVTEKDSSHVPGVTTSVPRSPDEPKIDSPREKVSSIPFSDHAMPEQLTNVLASVSNVVDEIQAAKRRPEENKELQDEIQVVRNDAESLRTKIRTLGGDHWQTLPSYIEGTNALESGDERFKRGELKSALSSLENATNRLGHAYLEERKFLAERERFDVAAKELGRALEERESLHGALEETIKAVRRSPRGFDELLKTVDDVWKRRFVIAGELNLQETEAALERVRGDLSDLRALKEEIGKRGLESQVKERDAAVAQEQALDNYLLSVPRKHDRLESCLKRDPEWNTLMIRRSNARSSIDAGKFSGLSEQFDDMRRSCERIVVAMESYLLGVDYERQRDDVLAVRYLNKANGAGISEARKILYPLCVRLQNDRAQTLAECRRLVENKLLPADSETLHYCRGLLARLEHEVNVLRELPVSDRELPPVMTQHGLKEHEDYIRKVKEIIKGRTPKPEITRTLALPNGVEMEMIYCRAGEYVSGDGNTPQNMDHGYWLGRYAVTQRQWESVMGENPADFKGNPQSPVENVSWDDCQEFIRRVEDLLHCGARLPTEQEWEYACRAGSRTPYSWGGELNGDMANCNGTVPYGTVFEGKNEKKTVEVGRYRPNAWGFYDMHGNVWEWCSDRFDAGTMVIRGGSWRSSAEECRSASRRGAEPGDRINTVGFRLCLTDANTASSQKSKEGQGDGVVRVSAPKVGDVFSLALPGGATMEFCWCPPGEFMMGSPSDEKGRFSNEQAPHLVVITNGFWMGKYEVTCAQWSSVFPNGEKRGEGSSDYPIEKVSWIDASNYIETVNASLPVNGKLAFPTEEQWEYAYRAGSSTPYLCGLTSITNKSEWANFDAGEAGGDRCLTTHVGSFRQNPWGLYDMAGNVREWCLTEAEGKKVVRGGAWCDHARRCRAASRIMVSPERKVTYIGFRLVFQPENS